MRAGSTDGPRGRGRRGGTDDSATRRSLLSLARDRHERADAAHTSQLERRDDATPLRLLVESRRARRERQQPADGGRRPTAGRLRHKRNGRTIRRLRVDSANRSADVDALPVLQDVALEGAAGRRGAASARADAVVSLRARDDQQRDGFLL